MHRIRLLKPPFRAYELQSSPVLFATSLFSSYNQTNTESIEDVAFSISSMLNKPNWENNQNLKSIVSHITPHVASKVMLLQNTNFDIGVRFFKWVCKQSTYCYDIEQRIYLLTLIVSFNLYGLAQKAIIVLLRESAKSQDETLKLLGALNELRDNGFRLSYPCYSTLLMSLAQLSMGVKAYAVFKRMVSDGFTIGDIDYKTMINVLCKNGLVQSGEMFFCKVLKLGVVLDAHIFTSLVLGYCRESDLNEAFRVFEIMCKEPSVGPNSVTFSILIHGLCETGRLDEAFGMKEIMAEKGCQPSTRTYTVLIKAVCDKRLVDKALNLFDEMVGRGCKPNAHTYTILIDGLCAEGKIEEANGMYQKMVKDGLFPTLVTYNVLINGYCKEGRIISAFELLSMMEKKNCKPNIRTYNELMEGLCRVKKPCKGMILLKRIVDNGLCPDRVTYNILIDRFCKEGQLAMAYKIYNSMTSSGIDPDCYTFTAIMDGLCKFGKPELGSAVLGIMVKKGIDPDEVTFTALIDGYCKVGKTRDSLLLFEMLNRNLYFKTSHSLNIFLDILSKACKLKEEYAMIGKMLRYGLVPTVVTYTILIDGLIRANEIARSFKIVELMKQSGCHPNVYTYTVLINGLCQLGRIEKAEELLFTMSDVGVCPNHVTYTVLIKAHVNAGRLDGALQIMNLMVKNGCQPQTRIYSALLSGFDLPKATTEVNRNMPDARSVPSKENDDQHLSSRRINVEHALRIQREIEKFGGSVTDLYNYLVVGLCKEGRIAEAHSLTQDIVKSGIFPDKAISSVIEIYCEEHKYDDAMEFLRLILSSGFLPAFKSYSLLIQGLYLEGRSKEAQRLVSEFLRSSGNEEEHAVIPYIEFLWKEAEPEKLTGILTMVECANYKGRPII